MSITNNSITERNALLHLSVSDAYTIFLIHNNNLKQKIKEHEKINASSKL